MQAIFESLNDYSVWIVIGSVIAAGILYYRWRTLEKLQNFARELGLTFSSTADDLVAAPIHDRPQDSGSTPLKTILRLFATWRLAGEMNGVPVQVYTEFSGSRDKKEKMTYLKALFHKPKSFEMRITRRHKQTVGDKFIARFLKDSLTEIQTGVETLDQALVIKGNEVAAIQSFLSDSVVQDQILRALEFDGQLCITDKGVEAIRSGNFADADKIRPILAMVVETARCLESAV